MHIIKIKIQICLNKNLWLCNYVPIRYLCEILKIKTIKCAYENDYKLPTRQNIIETKNAITLTH